MSGSLLHLVRSTQQSPVLGQFRYNPGLKEDGQWCLLREDADGSRERKEVKQKENTLWLNYLKLLKYITPFDHACYFTNKV